MHREPAVYILASGRNGTLYVGVTSDLVKRMHQHTTSAVDGFSKKYKVHSLMHFERHETMESAIVREKQLKKWNRLWKMRLIEENNPLWVDLWPSLLGLDSRLRGNDDK